MSLNRFPVLSPHEVESVKWAGDYNTYDAALCALGKTKYKKFVAVNPDVNVEILKSITDIPDIIPCVVWYHNGNWIAKLFNHQWNPLRGYRNLKLDITLAPIDDTARWITNPDIDHNLVFDPIPSYSHQPTIEDAYYNLVWYLDPKFNPTKDDIWVVKRVHKDKALLGTKNMGTISPCFPSRLDVVFISYYEPNAEENWQRVLAKAPWAQRVNGVTGILEAHKAAADLAGTDMFYVVDGDAYLSDNWTFDFQPGIFDRDAVVVWHSKNPINGLTYGYGGVKLFPTDLLKNATRWNTDLTTGLSHKLIVKEQVSNITRFNTSEFDTWRSAFRECAKLASGSIARQDEDESRRRMSVWRTASGGEYGNYSSAGADAGYKYGVENRLDIDKLKLINNRQWLKEQFEIWNTNT
jgi:hypothetical protein